MKIKSDSQPIHYLLPIILVAIIIIVHSSTTNHTNQVEAAVPNTATSTSTNTYWSTLFKANFPVIDDALITNDNKIFVVGSQDNGTLDFNEGWMALLNMDGTVVWEKKFSAMIAFRSALELADGSLLVVGDLYDPTLQRNPIISKFDAAGNLLWQKIYSANSDEVTAKIMRLNNGDFLIIGGGSDGWILKINSSGDIIWQKRYGDAFSENLRWGVQTANGSIYIVGSNTFGSPLNSADAWLLKINENGDIIWQKTYHNFEREQFNDILVTTTGELVVVGIATGTTSPNRAWVLKMNLDGSIIWEQEWWIPNNMIIFASVLEAQNGRIILSGSGQPVDKGLGLLAALDQDSGALLWAKYYGGEVGNDFLSTVIQAGSGDIIAAGATGNDYSVNDPDAKAWVMKLAEDGSMPGCTIINPTDLQPTPTAAVISTTSITPQPQNFVPVNVFYTAQPHTSPIVNQCHYEQNFSEYSFLPYMFLN